MLRHIYRAVDTGALTAAQAGALLDAWRRTYTYQPYATPAPSGTLRDAYAEARAAHDRRRLAALVVACAGAHQTHDPGRA